MSETSLVRSILLAHSRGDCRLFRNNVGVLQDRYGNYVRYGLAPGSSDLIGWQSVIVDQTMIGKRIAVFVGVEAKVARGRSTLAQRGFVELVKAAGGRAGEARSIEEAGAILAGILK
jgi:hypothetical protein